MRWLYHLILLSFTLISLVLVVVAVVFVLVLPVWLIKNGKVVRREGRGKIKLCSI